PPLPEVELIRPMYEHAMAMFKDGVDAFVREDAALARAVVPRDEKLDELNRAASRKLIERMAQDPDQLRGYLNLIFVGRCLERVGDHATNIAEDAVYAAAAEDIRHQPVGHGADAGYLRRLLRKRRLRQCLWRDLPRARGNGRRR